MKYLHVKNWEDKQHYKDRCPPWIKLHRDLLNDYEFSCLQDASKLHLMLIWLLASQMDNKIPADPNFIKERIGIKGEIDLKSLVSKGFLIDASNALADCKQLAIAETEAEAEAYSKETETEEAFSLWNEMALQNGLSPGRKCSRTRQQKIKARLKDCGGMGGWKAALGKVSASSFCLGGNERGWKLDLDFLISEAGFIKVMEDKYINKQNKGNNNGKETKSEQLDGSVNRVLAEYAAKREGHSGNDTPAIRHSGYIREDAGAVGQLTQSDD